MTSFNPRATWNTHGISRELGAAACSSSSAPRSLLPSTTAQCKQPWLPCAGSSLHSPAAPKQGRLLRGDNRHLQTRQKRWKSLQLERVSPSQPALLITARLWVGAPDWKAMSRLDSCTWRCRQFLPPIRYSGVLVKQQVFSDNLQVVCGLTKTHAVVKML